MIHRIILTLFVAAIMIGCSKSDFISHTSDQQSSYIPSGNAMNFTQTPVVWNGTRGVVYSNANLPTKMRVYAYRTEHNHYASTTTVETFMDEQLVEYKDNTWIYDPVQYWPSDWNDKISFFAFIPETRVTNTNKNEEQKPKFSYTLKPSAKDNNDLLAAVQYDKHRSYNPVDFEFKHALTRVSFKGKLSGPIPTNNNETNVKYIVKAIEFHGIRPKGELKFDGSGNISWNIDNTVDTITCTATQGPTLINNTLETTEKDLCIDNKSIFILPQDMTDAYINLRITKEYTDKKNKQKTSTYEIKNLKVPTAAGSNGMFLPGQWINITFTYEIGSETGSTIGNIISYGGDDATLTDRNNDKKINYKDVIDAMIEIAKSGEETIAFDFDFDSDLLFVKGDEGGKSVFSELADYIDAHKDEFPDDYTFSIDLSKLSGDYGDIKDIPANIFKGNTYLKSVTLPSEMKMIKESGFAGCANLEYVVIGSPTSPSQEGFDTIEKYAFSGCTSLKSVIVYTTADKSVNDMLKENVFNNTPLKNVKGKRETLGKNKGYKFSWVAP